MKTIANIIIIAAIAFIFAWMFCEGWDRQEYVDQARRANRQIERMP